MLFYGAHYHRSGPIFRNNQKAMICKNYNRTPNRCYGNLRFKMVNEEICCDVRHLVAFRAHSENCEYFHTNQQLRALGKLEFGMYRGATRGCEILNIPPRVVRSNAARPSSPTDERVLSGKEALMKAIGLMPVSRKEDDRTEHKERVSRKGQNGISENEVQLIEGFRSVKECLDQMMSSLEDLLSGQTECGNMDARSEDRGADRVFAAEEAGNFQNDLSFYPLQCRVYCTAVVHSSNWFIS